MARLSERVRAIGVTKSTTDDELLRLLNEAMRSGERRSLEAGHDRSEVLARLGRVAFEGLDFGDVVGVATQATRLGLEPLATVAVEALDHFTLSKKERSS